MEREDSAEGGLLLRDALERVTDGVAALDADLRYTAVNEAAATILGRTPESLRGTRVGEVFDDGRAVEEELEAAMADGRPTTLERYDAERDRWFEVRAHPDDDGLSLTLIDVTDRTERERELERQEYLFDSVQELADIGVWEYEPAADRLTWSDGVRAIHGVDASYEPTVAEAIEFYHPDDREVIRAAVDDAVEHGERYDLDLRIVRTGGEVRDVRTRGAVVSDDSNGTVLRGVFQDITERKERERELERFRAFVEHSSDTTSVVDSDGVIRYTSEAAGRTGGVPPETLVGRDAFERIHPDDRDAAERAFERALANPEESQVVQYRGRRGDGTWVWLESACVNRLDDGDVEGVVVVTRDITERKRREQERAALTEEYRAVFDNADDAIFLVDVEPDGDDVTFRYARLSPAHESQTGLTTAELKGKTPREALGPETGAEVARNYRRCVEAEEPITYQEVLALPGGARTWQTKLAPVVVDGEVTRIVGIARDVTEQVEYERELRRKNERLDEFASVISHDIRNPLSVAIGRVQLLEEESESGHLPPLMRSLLRIEAIVGDTLTLARHGETVAETESMSITGLVGQCWGTVDVADATLEVDDEFTVRGDRDRLRHVFENLFSNSITHGGPDVTVRVGRLGEDGIYVADDGPGIVASERETVFEPGHKSSAGGTGFGLSIVRRIAEAHGWTVTATESETGGAQFEFRGVDIVD
jgi:PAS domain S-box-containing protein